MVFPVGCGRLPRRGQRACPVHLFEHPFPTPGEVPCFITIQPIDVCGTSGTSTCAPFNTTSTTGVGTPGTAGMPFSNGLPVNETSPNPIGFVVNPATGVPPTRGAREEE